MLYRIPFSTCTTCMIMKWCLTCWCTTHLLYGFMFRIFYVEGLFISIFHSLPFISLASLGLTNSHRGGVLVLVVGNGCCYRLLLWVVGAGGGHYLLVLLLRITCYCLDLLMVVFANDIDNFVGISSSYCSWYWLFVIVISICYPFWSLH